MLVRHTTINFNNVNPIVCASLGVVHLHRVPSSVHPCKTEVAASVYRLVLADLSLADVFGQVDLSWLPVIKSAPTVVCALWWSIKLDHTVAGRTRRWNGIMDVLQ